MKRTAYSTPLSSLEDADFGSRFCYWSGKSGRRYIHSIYRLEDCPILPGAVYLVLRPQQNGQARPVDLFILDSQAETIDRSGLRTGDRLHVHMLTDDMPMALQIANDLAGELFGRAPMRLIAGGRKAREAGLPIATDFQAARPGWHSLEEPLRQASLF